MLVDQFLVSFHLWDKRTVFRNVAQIDLWQLPIMALPSLEHDGWVFELVCFDGCLLNLHYACRILVNFLKAEVDGVIDHFCIKLDHAYDLLTLGRLIKYLQRLEGGHALHAKVNRVVELLIGVEGLAVIREAALGLCSQFLKRWRDTLAAFVLAILLANGRHLIDYISWKSVVTYRFILTN